MGSPIRAINKLYLFVMCALFILSVLGIYGVYQLSVMNQNSRSIYSDRVLPLEELTNIRQAYSYQITELNQELKYQKISRQEALDKLVQIEKYIAHNWNKYKKTYLTREEKIGVVKAESLMEATSKTMNKLKTTPFDENETNQKDVIYLELANQINQLRQALNQLVALQVKVGESLKNKNKKVYTNTKTQFIVLIVGSFLLILILAFVIIRDIKALITNLKKSKKKLLEDEVKIRAYVEHAGDAFFILNTETIITDVNNAGCTLLSYTRDELIGLKISDLVPTEEIEKQRDYISLVKKDQSSHDWRKLKRKDGTTVDVEINTNLSKELGYVAVIRDITERKKAETSIQESEQKYRYLFENNPAHIIIWDLEKLEVLEVNQAVVDDYGYTKEEWKGMSVFAYRPQEDHEKIKEFSEKMLVGDYPMLSASWRHLKKNGELMYMDINSHKMIYNGRKAILSLARNITERKQVESELRKSEEKHRSLIENIHDAIVLLDKSQTILYQSPSVQRISGYSLKDRIQLKSFEFVYHEDLKLVDEIIHKTLQRPNEVIQFKCRINHKNGPIIWIEATVINLLSNESIQAIVLTYRDVSERTKAEEQQALILSIVNSSDDGIISKTLDGNISSWNRGAEKIFGYSAHEMIGQNITKLIPNDLMGEEIELLASISKGNHIDHYETRRVNKGGQIMDVSLTISPILDAKNNIIGASKIIRDISFQKKAQREILHLNETLEQKVIDRTEELQNLNQVLKIRNLEITNSITYAQNIQRAILSTTEDCKNIFPDAFVVWMPKDLVSGDFSWCFQGSKYQFIAAVDCTGHGVPGAYISIIANQLLERIIISQNTTEPDEILMELDKEIVNALKQESGIIHDGLDIALCRIDSENKSLVFAGAQRPLFYYDGANLQEIEGNKMGIGGFFARNHVKTFYCTEIQYKKDDIFYLTSDGYYSQFGGEFGKKLMKKKFLHYLAQIANQPMSEQEKLLFQHFKQWQGDEEQVDDVLVIGIKM